MSPWSSSAGYEADRANVPLTLVTLDELASLVVAHYETFDMDGRVLIPLTHTAPDVSRSHHWRAAHEYTMSQCGLPKSNPAAGE